MTDTVISYLAYVVLCVGVTIWVGRTLRHHGSVYLTDGHEENRSLHEALSHLLVVGFYLINLGVICFVLKVDRAVADMQASIEMLSTKVGTVLLILGGVHFVVLVALAGARKQAAIEHRANHRLNIGREVMGHGRTTLVPDAFE